MENNHAFIHAVRGDGIGPTHPQIGGDPETLLELDVLCLHETLAGNPALWKKAYRLTKDVLWNTAPKGMRLNLVLRRIALIGVIALAFLSLFCLGYFLKVRAFV